MFLWILNLRIKTIHDPVYLDKSSWPSWRVAAPKYDDTTTMLHSRWSMVFHGWWAVFSFRIFYKNVNLCLIRLFLPHGLEWLNASFGVQADQNILHGNQRTLNGYYFQVYIEQLASHARTLTSISKKNQTKQYKSHPLTFLLYICNSYIVNFSFQVLFTHQRGTACAPVGCCRTETGCHRLHMCMVLKTQDPE